MYFIVVFMCTPVSLLCVLVFLGGNQRELARAKNLKKQQEQKKKTKDSGASLEERKHR